MIKNLSFDFAKGGSKKEQLTERKYKTLTTLLSADFSKTELPKKTIIYGAGITGRELYRKVRPLTSVQYFVDNDQKKQGSQLDGIKIIPESEMYYVKDAKVIVTVTHDFEKIRGRVKRKYQSEDIISLDDILGLKFENLNS